MTDTEHRTETPAVRPADESPQTREHDEWPARLATGLLGLVGIGIGIGLFSFGSTWLADGSHGQAGWLLRIGGVAVFGGSIMLAASWRPRRVRWVPLVLVAACIGTMTLGVRLLSFADADNEPVIQQDGTWYTRAGDRAASPTEHDAIKVGSWLLIVGGVAGLGALAITDFRRKSPQR